MIPLVQFLGLGAILAALYVSVLLFYNVFLHPLRRFPGPLWMRATRAGWGYKSITGTLPFDMLDLHKKYGQVVRIAPDELSFANPQAWNDIMGHRRQGGGGAMDKYMPFIKVIDEKPTDIINANRDEHAMLRRALAHGFSDRSMRAQEPIIMKYVDLLIQRLQERCKEGNAVNIAAWYNYTTFDVIGDLAFGEAFGCLDNSDYHPWVKTIFMMARSGTVLQAATHYPLLKKLLFSLIPKRIMEDHSKHEEMTMLKLKRRMELEHERPDLIEGLLRQKDQWGLTMGKLQANASILIIGGSETTATLLSGVTFLLLTRPDALRTLTEEVRSAYKSEEEINFTSVGQLRYMLACLDEAFRIYPPVPIGVPRITPEGGAVICDEQIPGDTAVAVHQWSLYHNETYFKVPFEFHPERFLGDPRFANDRLDALQPFHLGPRACIGRNLAYVEMRTIFARVIWNFDMSIAEDSRNWMERQKIYNFWDKGPLNVYLTPVEH